MTAGWFRVSDSLAPRPRAVTSVALPAANGTTILIGLLGKSCARATPGSARAAAPRSVERRLRSTRPRSLAGASLLAQARPVVAGRRGEAKERPGYMNSFSALRLA